MGALMPRDVEGFVTSLSAEDLAIGQWYSVTLQDRDPWLGCVTHVGSNYLTLESPGGMSVRVHFDQFWACLKKEQDPDAVIQSKIAHYQLVLAEKMAQVNAVTARLGVTRQGQLAAPGASDGQALMVLSDTPDIAGYQAALVKARDTDLPALFTEIRKANEKMAVWMSAQMLPMKAQAASLNGTIDAVKNRLFNVSLYAGLSEQLVECCGGEPAPYHEKLHAFQRMCFMDEEALLGYRHGGMEFKDIALFDAWMAEPANRDRILPMPRCLVAMRVRRHVKEREHNGTLLSAYINFQLEQSDKYTFLYIRNGERVYRLISDLDFGEHLFPDRSVFDPAEPMMAEMFAGRPRKLLSRSEYDVIEKAYLDAKADYEAWERDHPRDANGDREEWNPKSYPSFGQYEPFDPSSVYFDDIAAMVSAEIRQYNRVALLIQGLYDRSEALHPHPPVRTWSAEGFAAAITLVYDATTALVDGEAPDFEAYRAQCNASLTAASIVCGQERAWLEHEAAKENALRSRSARSTEARVTTYQPYGNPGPGYLARMAEWKPRARQAVFTWHRRRQTADRWNSRLPGKRYGDLIPTRFTVSADRLFNVSAYRPGDYLQFFRDHRTRAQYLKWAPMLLAAEEWHAGNAQAKEPLADE